MFIKNVNPSLKKILVFSIVLLFLGSSLIVGITSGVPIHQVPVKKLELETAEMSVKVDASDNSKMVTIDTTNNIIYGDDWCEVVNPDGSRTRRIGIPTYFKDEAYHPVDTNIVPLDDGEYQYGVEEGKYQVYFKEDITEPIPVMVNYQNYELSMQFNEMGYYNSKTDQYITLSPQSSFGSPATTPTGRSSAWVGSSNPTWRSSGRPT